MVEIKRVEDKETLKKIGAGAGESAFAAVSGGEITGYCIYRLEQGRVVLEKLFERDGDMVLADGIVRAAVAAHRDCADTVVISGIEGFDEYRVFFGLSKNELSIEDFLKTNCE